MRKKIQKAFILTTLITLLIIYVILFLQMQQLGKKLMDGNEQSGAVVEGMSAEAMGTMTRELLTRTSKGMAGQSDGEFAEFAEDVHIMAGSIQDIYTCPDSYGETRLETYDADNKGEIVTYAAYGVNVDPESEEISEELGKLSAVRGLLTSINESSENMASSYFATETGIFLGSETIADYNIPVDGEPLRFEARTRPWYAGAVEAGDTYFTGMYNDVDTGAYAMTCAVPVYVDGSLKGVAGAGMYLDTLRNKIGNYKVGNNGYACVINDLGQVLFSGTHSGELAATDSEYIDIRNSTNKELALAVKDALSGQEDIRIVTMDGENYYIAFSPMTTMGWTYMVVLPEKEVLTPTQDLMESLSARNAAESQYVGDLLAFTAIGMLIFLIVAAVSVTFVARYVAKKLVEPVVMLTDKVRDIKGDNLDFTWDIDTGDEVQTLAGSFESMTLSMKQYIKDITEITAEKERIGAELAVAKNIQASMLPCVFPPFPDRKEFDLYANMDPAKEVGGDFYDFFFVDDDHIAIVIADVSGKGIPAALFMVVAKTLIKNHARACENVEDVLMNSNDQLCEGNGEELFVTAWIGVIDLKTRVMKYSEAGHENPYIMHEDGSINMLIPPKKKPPLAAMEGMKYLPNEITLSDGDCIFLYTDGVAEATNAENELYGTERLERMLKQHYDKDPETLLKNVRADVDEFVAEAPQFDDLTMLAFRLHTSEARKDG